jgi:hypothetical protein
VLGSGDVSLQPLFSRHHIKTLESLAFAAAHPELARVVTRLDQQRREKRFLRLVIAEGTG